LIPNPINFFWPCNVPRVIGTKNAINIINPLSASKGYGIFNNGERKIESNRYNRNNIDARFNPFLEALLIIFFTLPFLFFFCSIFHDYSLNRLCKYTHSINYRIKCSQNSKILALLSVILFVAGVGIFDDLFGWHKGGLRRRHRLILAALGAIPLMVINAGKSEVTVPFLGMIDLGLIFPLIVLPIGLIGATYSFNFLAGFNGLEAGQGILLLGGLSIVAFFTGSSWLSVIALCMIVSLFAFLFYNFFPAKVFPGDSITYATGALIAAISILGNFERIAVFFFIPYILETILKVRGKLVKHSFGKPKKDGSIELRYNKLYSLNHVSIWTMQKLGIKPTERKVVYSIWGFQLLVIIIGFIVFQKGIF